VSALLEELFDSLVLPLEQPTGRSLSAAPIPGYENYRLAKDSSGSPCLLLRQAHAATPTSPIRLQNLIVSYGVPCLITRPDNQQEEGTFTIVKCSNVDPSLFPHFLRILSPVIVTLGAAPTTAAVRRAISGLVDLFQALTMPAKKSVQGLWAELFVIRNSSNPQEVARAWHGAPEEHIDFVNGRHRIEVKSSSTRTRVHHFSMLQLTPPAQARLVVASVFVENIGGGVSLRQLTDGIRAILTTDPHLLARFDAVFYATLGAGWAEAMEERFDFELAGESLRFFDSEHIPKITRPIPTSVSDVRFCSDLSGVASLVPEALNAAGGLFAATLPAK
jgi:hypothetical protein